MKIRFIRAWTLTSFLLVLALMVPGWAAAEVTFNRIVVFGTSFSDPGNAYALTGGTTSPPYNTLDPFLVPSDQYAVGGEHHFSNGETWIEQLARSLGLAENTRPAFQKSGKGATNYAVGGARAYEDGKNVNLSEQVSTFLHDFGGVAPSDALYVIEMGGNDLRDAVAVAVTGGDGGAVIKEALTSIEDNLAALYGAGARKFLVWNAPNIQISPAIHILDTLIPGAGQQAKLLTITFNAGLDSLLKSLKGSRRIEIVRFDLYQKINEMIANPGAIGVSVVDATCVIPNGQPSECQTPDAFFFWDGIHPTRAVHAMVAVQVALTLAGEKEDKRSQESLNPFIKENEPKYFEKKP